MRKKLVVKVVFKFGMILGIFLGMTYYFYGAGNLSGFFSGLDFEKEEAGKSVLPDTIQSVVTDQEVTVYQWVDENGIKQFGSLPPEGIGAEAMHLKPDQNVVPSVKVTESKEDEEETGRDEPILKNPYNPDTVKQLINDAKNVKELLDQRYQK
ncbi:MAG: DUF4124 domain-containing protein [Gammaproteobacteria bacterium]|nr:DUF4124 domain-containing protein [Gammaproteobacteria bacterium]